MAHSDSQIIAASRHDDDGTGGFDVLGNTNQTWRQAWSSIPYCYPLAGSA